MRHLRHTISAEKLRGADKGDDETSGAQLVADHLGIPINHVPLGPDDFTASFDDFIFALDELRMGAN